MNTDDKQAACVADMMLSSKQLDAILDHKTRSKRSVNGPAVNLAIKKWTLPIRYKINSKFGL